MRRKVIPSNGGVTALYRTVVLTMLAGIAVVAVAFANRNVYTRSEVDIKLNEIRAVAEAVQELERTRDEDICRRLELIESDVRWMVRQMGGTPSAAETR